MIKELEPKSGSAKSRRIKVTAPMVKTRAEMEALVGQIAELKIYETKTKALMDERLTEIRSEYEVQLGAAAEDIEYRMELARAWAEANPMEFGHLKSIEMSHGVIGFRTGTPKLKPLSGWTWDRVLEKLLRLGYDQFLRTKTEVDKEAIIGCREDLLDGDLKAMGIKITQDESFYVEPKLTPVEKREIVKA
jgi:phage host-nuclease inhibitor protein Gam